MGERPVTSLRSKLNPPRLAADLIGRPRLVERLERGRRLPLGLTCAPAGYGKSTLVASWLEEAGQPFAWLSLDEADSDLSQFVEYFVAAVRTAVPGACAETLAMVEAPEPRPEAVAGCLVNELEELEGDLVLALDDYHRIGGTAVHDLMDRVLRYPPRPLHLEIVARFDPPLPLIALRARGQMSEIRERELRFSRSESKTFFDRVLDSPLKTETLARLEEVTEGWAVGMRLAALISRGRDVDDALAGLRGKAAQLSEYFVSEVLAQLPAERRDRLLRAALFEPFCADLLNALFTPAGDAGTPGQDGEALIDWIEGSGLFLVALDARREWFRFHHLFRGLLLEQLCHRAAAGEIDELRLRAAGWFEAHGHLEEAMSEVLNAGGPAPAAGLVKRHRHELTRREEWKRLHRLMELLPADLVRADLELLVIRAWVCENRIRYAEMFEVLDEIRTLAAAPAPAGLAEVGLATDLLGEIDALRSIRHYQACDGERTVAASRRALGAIPEEHFCERSYALVLNSLGHQMNGHLERAESVVLQALADRSRGGSPYRARILIGLGLVYWMDGSVARVIRTARELLALGERHGLSESADYGRYFLGVGSYDRGDLAAAEEALAPLVERRSRPTLSTWTHSSVALALTRLAAGDPERARELGSAMAARGLGLQHPELLALAEAFEAELALRQGRVHEAAHWARSYRPVIRAPRHRFFLVELTLARVLLAEGTDRSGARAAELLEALRASLSAAHHRRFEAEVLALQALSADRQGQELKALDVLRRAVDVAHPRGLVQPFVDLGPGFMRLLARLDAEEPAASFRRTLLAAASLAPPAQPPAARRSSSEHLSNRELDVLGLLARRLSNKEIAAELYLSTDTVKRHNTNIFRKLRRQQRQVQLEERAQHCQSITTRPKLSSM